MKIQFTNSLDSINGLLIIPVQQKDGKANAESVKAVAEEMKMALEGSLPDKYEYLVEPGMKLPKLKR